jgi:hypothetical protein
MEREKEAGEGKSEGADASGKLLPNAKEIDALLKRGAYDVFRYTVHSLYAHYTLTIHSPYTHFTLTIRVFRDDDTAAEQFAADTIDQILERSSRVVQYASEARSNFSKASFVARASSTNEDGTKDEAADAEESAMAEVHSINSTVY